jgi:hypothetical protein
VPKAVINVAHAPVVGQFVRVTGHSVGIGSPQPASKIGRRGSAILPASAIARAILRSCGSCPNRISFSCRAASQTRCKFVRSVALSLSVAHHSKARKKIAAATTRLIGVPGIFILRGDQLA